ncbi:MAG TPA: PEP/pyruvate-binding domain-containing protein [Terriglobia bacterium]|nr:PEP/pyruvate-binding domain-containing protein [Terriglobia bacterium]
MRRVKAAALPEDLGPEDIVVFDAAPFDVPTPIAAAITAAPHAELSHLNVRSAARGTPSCRVADAMSRFESWEGKLARVECGAEGVAIRAASAAEVADAVRRRRPLPVTIAPPDLSGALVNLLEIPADGVAERSLSRRRYGAKAANLATLAQRIPAAWTVRGFAIPLAAYDAFIHQGSPSLASRIDEIFADARVLADPAYRKTRLAALRAAFEKTSVDPETLRLVSGNVETMFGADTMVRFRSSSNAEDDVLFNGAGLYDSVSVCLADDRDSDSRGPSRCDGDTKEERGVARGLVKVWASLWTDRAVAERLWYGIDPRRVAMGVLVDPRAKSERANIVAFTASPNGPAFLVEAQKGELAVVSSEPGVWPEQTRLRIGPGNALSIERMATSSEAKEVLTESVLRELGARLVTIQSLFPVDDKAPAGADIILDTEWKVLADGRLIIKQIRPFLRRPR